MIMPRPMTNSEQDAADKIKSNSAVEITLDELRADRMPPKAETDTLILEQQN